MKNNKPMAIKALQAKQPSGKLATNATQFFPALTNLIGKKKAPAPLKGNPAKAHGMNFKQYGEVGYNPVGRNVTKN